MPHRCAFGCVETDMVMHVFPNPEKFPERFKMWVDLVGGRLEGLSDLDIYKKKRICDVHFINNHRNRFKCLNALAVPSLHLPSSFRDQQISDVVDVPPSASVPNAASVADAASVPDAGFNPDVVSLGSSRAQQISDVVDVPPSASVPDAASVADAASVPDAGFKPDVASLGETSKATATVNIFMEHNYSGLSKSRPKRSDTGFSGRNSFCVYAQPLQKKIRYLRNEISRLRKKGKLYNNRLANAEKIAKNVAFQQIVKHMTKPAQLFMYMQLQTKKKPKGRRFTIEEKILSLSLYKKSPKCYRLLCNYFSLPSNKAMKRLLSQIKLNPGINNIIFEKIKKTICNKEPSDRLCSLIFDEMSITPQIFYTAAKDQLEGFCSNGRTFADHVLVFMIKGVKNNFKQPIAYYFTNSLNKLELKNILKSVIKNCLESGLIVINTVCDQCPVNVGALREIVNETKATFLRQRKEWRHEVMRIKGHNIVPLYDTPHLFKGLRNNLINKNLKYMSNNEEKTIKWDYYQMVYDADKSYGELRLLNKITEEHIYPDKINKMRVKTATQLFSHSVAVVTEHLTARGDLPVECRQLIDFTILLDNLFDSLNVSSFSIPNGKIYKGPVKRNSPHHELWKKSKILLNTLKYFKNVKVLDKIRLVETVVPSVTNLIKTIEGMEILWKTLSTKYSMDTLLTRNLNQDPLENFFGNIRSYGARNIAPNTVSFEGAYKALLLNNFSSPHSRRSNCEEDFNECLQTYDFFLKEKINAPDTSEETDTNFSSEICFDQLHQKDAGQGNYVCGWVIKTCLKKVVKGCQNCKKTLLGTSNDNNAFIKAKEYSNKKWLCYPSEQAEFFFNDVQNMAISFLKNEVRNRRLKQSILTFTDILIDSPFDCPIHKTKLKEVFVNTTINVIIYSWCRSINRILSGKLTYNGDDKTKIAAQNYFNKHKNYKNRK